MTNYTNRTIAFTNNIVLIGNLGSDPELRTVGQNKVAEFNIATERYDYSSKERVTEWVRVSVWNKMADTAMKYLTKGRKVAVTADELRVSAADDGKIYFQVNARNLRFLSGGNGNGSSQEQLPQDYQPSPDVDSIPF